MLLAILFYPPQFSYMQRLLPTVLFLTLLSTALSAQKRATLPGYIIDDSGTRKTVFFDNIEWKNTPTTVSYRLTETGGLQKASVEDTKEFGITDGDRYVRFEVKVDVTSLDNNGIYTGAKMNWLKQKMFLKALVVGDAASLYVWDRYKNQTFFLHKPEFEAPQVLVHKQYYASHNRIRTFEAYRPYLAAELECNSLNRDANDRIRYKSKSPYDKVRYRTRSLVNAVVYFNECKSSAYTAYVRHGDTQNTINLCIRVGASYTTATREMEAIIDPYWGRRIEADMEYRLPILQRKVGALIGLAYDPYAGRLNTPTFNVPTTYRPVESSFGLRYYHRVSSHLEVVGTGRAIFDIAPTFYDGFRSSLGGVHSYYGLGIGVGYRRFYFNYEWRSEKNLNDILYLRGNAITLGYRLF